DPRPRRPGGRHVRRPAHRHVRRRGGNGRGGRARHGGRRAPVIQVERRLEHPRWLSVAVPVASGAASLLILAPLLRLTRHDPIHIYRRVFDAAFVGSAAWTATFVSATPLMFTGLAAAVAFRMKLYNIGGEGQLYLGAIGAAGAAIWLGPGHPTAVTALAMCV